MGVIDKHYGIKFPFTIRNNDNVFLDLNNNLHEKVASEIAHVILTPKKSRIRMPDFGTNLIKYIFSPNNDDVWGDIEYDIRANVTKYVPEGVINGVEVYHSEGDDNAILLSVNFGVKKGNTIENNKMVIKL